MRRRTLRVILVLAATALIALSAACSPEEETAFRSVEALRDAHHLEWFDWNDAVYKKAVDWSVHMADEGRLSHSNLADGVPSGWHKLGENVAMADTVERAMTALENSPPHLANLLDPAFTSIAIGVVKRDGRVWVTEVFVG
jgi:uncharacterized protein YkwD